MFSRFYTDAIRDGRFETRLCCGCVASQPLHVRRTHWLQIGSRFDHSTSEHWDGRRPTYRTRWTRSQTRANTCLYLFKEHGVWMVRWWLWTAPKDMIKWSISSWWERVVEKQIRESRGMVTQNNLLNDLMTATGWKHEPREKSERNWRTWYKNIFATNKNSSPKGKLPWPRHCLCAPTSRVLFWAW